MSDQIGVINLVHDPASRPAWCEEHEDFAWMYDDGSGGCFYTCIVETGSSECRLVPLKPLAKDSDIPEPELPNMMHQESRGSRAPLKSWRWRRTQDTPEKMFDYGADRVHPEKCPTCGSDDPKLVHGYRYRIDEDCPDPFHSEKP